MATGAMTTITQKGQVTIPKNIREMVSLGLRSRVYVEPAKGYVKIVPTKDILDMAGSVRPKKNKDKSVLAARKKMEKSYQRF
jgi:AbrB family looped-hinge helix DNA binding protein